MQSKSAAWLTETTATEIRAIRREVRIAAGRGGQCGEVAEWIYGRFGWTKVGGMYLSASLEPIGDHVWNVLPNGSILDATADQFCEGHDIRLVPAGSPEQQRYRFEWTADFNPDLADQYPELTGIPWSGEFDVDASQRLLAERGEGWWLSDPSRYRQWDPVSGYEPALEESVNPSP